MIQKFAAIVQRAIVRKIVSNLLYFIQYGG